MGFIILNKKKLTGYFMCFIQFHKSYLFEVTFI